MADIETTVACCSKCRAFKRPTEFSKDKRKKNGLSSACKSCTNQSFKSSAAYAAKRVTL